jgi:signal peptidase I
MLFANLTTHTRLAVRFGMFALLALTVDAGMMGRRMLEKVGRNTPEPVIVAEGLEMEVAEAAAAEMGGTAFWGVGESMQPLYAPKTAIVIKELAYDDIKKGMTVVYRKPNGKYVAHAVVGEDANGYIVQGMNNAEPDEVSVNEKNLVGVITAAFSANTTQFHAQLARRAGSLGKAVASRGTDRSNNF